MSRKASPAVLGAFVVAGISLALAALVVFGGRRLFPDTEVMIIYFDGSVAGLRNGAPVKFRGVDIGWVREIRISMPGDIRAPQTVRIPVLVEIDRDMLRGMGVAEIELAREQVAALVADGLRAQLATESLVTGIRYVALDIRPDTPAELIGDADGRYPEIPAIPTPFEQITENVERIIAKVAEVDIVALGDSLEATIADARALLRSPDLQRAMRGLDELIASLNQTVSELPSQEVAPLVAEWREVAISARRLLAPDGAVATGLAATLGELRLAARSIRRLADQIGRDPGSLVRGGRP